MAATLNVVLLGNVSPNDTLHLTHYRTSLKELVRDGHLRLASQRDASGYLINMSLAASLQQLERFLPNLRFDSGEGLWLDTTITGPPFKFICPFLVLTATGVAESRRVLRKHGYQWWSPIRF